MMALSFMKINGKVVLITGASQGIGAASASAFRRRGALLALTGRSEQRLRDAAGPADLAVAGDITDAGFRAELVQQTLSRFGRIDILVNNAGAGLYTPTWQVEDAQLRALFELNVFAPISLTSLVVPSMRERRGGMIVNLSSIAGKVTLPWFTLYCASKYAVSAFSDGLRMELKRDGIHVMAVCPGYVRTAFQENVLSAQPPEAIRRHQQMAIPAAECAGAIVRGVERDAATVVTPWVGRLLIAAARLMPGMIESRLEKIYRDGVPEP